MGKCKKVTYRSKLSAKITLAGLQTTDRDQKRIYWCKEHQGYHTTKKG